MFLIYGCKQNMGYFYLEIPCWTDDGNETWKKLIDNMMKEVRCG